jgi:hypothetical protein
MVNMGRASRILTKGAMGLETVSSRDLQYRVLIHCTRAGRALGAKKSFGPGIFDLKIKER